MLRHFAVAQFAATARVTLGIRYLTELALFEYRSKSFRYPLMRFCRVHSSGQIHLVLGALPSLPTILLSRLDTITGVQAEDVNYEGFVRGGVYLLAGGPSIGKTTLASQILDDLATIDRASFRMQALRKAILPTRSQTRSQNSHRSRLRQAAS
jgi:hypothetical protein